MRVCVVGAGVIGLSTTLKILDLSPEAKVTLVADRFPPDVTSSNVAGFWEPFAMGDTPEESYMKWASCTFSHCLKLIREGEGSSLGIELISGYHFSPGHTVDPTWKDDILGYRRVTQREIDEFAPHAKGGTFFTTITCNGARYLPWLLEKIQERKCTIVRKNVGSLDEGETGCTLILGFFRYSYGLNDGVVACDTNGGIAFGEARVTELDAQFVDSIVDALGAQSREANPLGLQGARGDGLVKLANDFDVLVNCAGLGARGLAQDDSLVPYQGQLLTVKGVSHKLFWMDTCGPQTAAVFPRDDEIIVGSTVAPGVWSTTPSMAVQDDLLTRAKRLVPSLKNGVVVKSWVGLRPFRQKGVRLEQEIVTFGTKKLKVVHNYGHGGSGVTLHWGCAEEAARLVQSCRCRLSVSKL